MAVSLVVLAFVQVLEWFNERQEGWRLSKREFMTDVFYVALNKTASSWLATTMADDPMTAAKQALGISTLWAKELPFLAQVVLGRRLISAQPEAY